MSISAISPLKNIEAHLQFTFPTFDLPVNPFSGKFSLNWKDSVMIAGVALAVVSAAGAFFLNLTAAAVAFLALGVILAFSAYYVHNFNAGIELQQTVDQLKQDNSTLQEAQKKIQASNADMQRQYTEVQGINRQLNQTITTLQATTQRLQTANADLTRNNQALQANLQQLTQNNQALQQRVTQLQQAITFLKAQVAGFADQNVLMGKDLSILNMDAVGIDTSTKDLAKTINGMDMTFDKDVQDLSEQIQRAKAVSATLFSTLTDQKKVLEQQIGKLTASIGSLQDLDRQLQQRGQELSALQLQLAAKTGNLQSLEKQIDQTQRTLAATSQAYNAEALKLSGIQSTIAAQEVQLEQTKLQLLAFPQKLVDAEAELQSKIDDVEKRQQINLAAVSAKIQLFIQQAQAKKLELADLDRQIEQKKRDLAAVH